MHRHLPLSVQINGHQAATRLSFQPHHFSLSFKYLYLLYIMIQTPFKYNSNFKYPSNIIKTSWTVNFFPFHLVWNIHSSTNCRFCRSSVDFLLHPWSGVSESSPRGELITIVAQSFLNLHFPHFAQLHLPRSLDPHFLQFSPQEISTSPLNPHLSHPQQEAWLGFDCEDKSLTNLYAEGKLSLSVHCPLDRIQLRQKWKTLANQSRVKI